MNQSTDQKKKPQTAQIPKKITETYLHNSGLYYLQRYAASTKHFHRVMVRKIKRSCQYHKEQNLDDCIILLDAVIEKFKRAQLLDDDTYGYTLFLSLKRKGTSQRMIAQKMSVKGLSQDQIKTFSMRYVNEFNIEDLQSQELCSALILCKKKRIGPFYQEHSYQTREREPQKEMAKLARAGFSYEICQKAYNMPQQDALDLINSIP